MTIALIRNLTAALTRLAMLAATMRLPHRLSALAE